MAENFESAQQRFTELVAWDKANDYGLRRNEAQTRFYLIDTILECLNWDKDHLSVEDCHNGSFADYTLGKPARYAVLEAKREGIYFELPAGFRGRICKLSTVFEAQQSIRDALEQVISYCQDRGIGVGIVSNGHQLIAFLASRQDGIPPLEGRGLVFPSLEEMLEDFRILWDTLSQPGLVSRNLYSALKDTSIQPPPQKLSQGLHDYPGFKGRNPFQTELQILGEIVLEDVARSPEFEKNFLERCYCTSGALSNYALVSKQILQTRYSTVLQEELELPNVRSASARTGVSPELAADLLAAAVTQRPIILLGDVGVGKTIFLRHLITIDASELLGKSVVLYIDFGREPALATDLEKFVEERCAAQLLETYSVDIDEDRFVRGVYHSDLVRFSKGIFAPLKEIDPKAYLLQEIEFLAAKKKERASHLKASLDHISKARKTPVVIFLDNIDQRPPNFQEQVFLIAQSLAATWPATVFVCLRPDTFAASSVKGTLSAYHPRVFTVSPPRIDLVISKRLAFALDELGATGRLRSLPNNLTLTSGLLSEYLHVLVESFEQSDTLIEFIDNLSGGNTRQALEFMSDFVGSGHVDAQKIIDTYREEGSYFIPVHEFLRAATYRDHKHYDPTVSRVANLFDVSTPDGREHFLLANLIAYIERSAGTSTGNEGFVEVDRVFDFGQALAFQPDQIRDALDRCLGKKLLDSNPRFSTSQAVTSVRVTTIGAYTIHRLAGMFAYVDAMIVDTPIVSPDARSRIHDAESIRERLDRADTFRDYLNHQWIPLQDKPHAFDWTQASGRLRDDISRISRKLPTPKSKAPG